jgi:hypothetical protein
MRHAKRQVLVIGALVMLGGGRARAQQEAVTDFGQKGVLALSAERMFGFVHADQTTGSGATARTTHVNSFSLLGNSSQILTSYLQPRVALDFFAADRLSLGAALTYFHISQSVDGSNSNPTISGYVLAPRVGYALPLGRAVSLWPRLGFTYVHFETGNNAAGSTTTDISVYAVTIEAPLLFAVSSHFFLSLAPTLDLGVGGSTSTPGPMGATTSTDRKETDYGVVAGLGGFW